MFQWEINPEDGGIYFFAEEGPIPYVTFDEIGSEGLQTIIEESRALSPQLCHDVEKAGALDTEEIDIDETGGYDAIFQTIVKRNSQALPYISIEQSFTCTRMRPDGFGGASTLITSDAIEYISTAEWLRTKIAGLTDPMETQGSVST
jgi:hypothetical protein